jgi:nondiscriminating glutamyl-tRNA synthetase
LTEAVRPLLAAATASSSELVAQPTSLRRLLELLRPRAKRLSDFVDQATPLLTETVAYESDAVAKHLSAPGLAGHIGVLADRLRAAEPFDEAHTEAALRGAAAECGVKAGVLIHATRVAMTGRTTSPGLFDVLTLLGRERTIARLTRLRTFLQLPPAV